MKPLRWLGAGLLWLLAGVIGLLGAILCVTVVLIPLGIPLLMLARRLVALAGKLVLPRAVRHPVKELGDKSSDTADDALGGTKKALRKGHKNASKAMPDKAKKLRKKTERKLGRRKGIKQWT